MSDFPDYEASRAVAGRLIHEYISFITEMANPGNQIVTGEMVTKGNERILRLMDEVVDVALGDGPYYAPATCHIHEYGDNVCCVIGEMRKVWPKEAADADA